MPLDNKMEGSLVYDASYQFVPLSEDNFLTEKQQDVSDAFLWKFRQTDIFPQSTDLFALPVNDRHSVTYFSERYSVKS